MYFKKTGNRLRQLWKDGLRESASMDSSDRYKRWMTIIRAICAENRRKWTSFIECQVWSGSFLHFERGWRPDKSATVQWPHFFEFFGNAGNNRRTVIPDRYVRKAYFEGRSGWLIKKRLKRQSQLSKSRSNSRFQRHKPLFLPFLVVSLITINLRKSKTSYLPVQRVWFWTQKEIRRW